MGFLGDANIDRLLWPSSSPDLSPGPITQVG